MAIGFDPALDGFAVWLDDKRVTEQLRSTSTAQTNRELDGCTRPSGAEIDTFASYQMSL
jgi:hypothetical protein